MAGIPRIESYPMPTADYLPANTAQWAVDPDRAVLLIHDMQRYFLRPFSPADTRGDQTRGDQTRGPKTRGPKTLGDELVRNTAVLRNRCSVLGVPVAYTVQPGGMTAQQRGLLKDFWGPGMRVDPVDRKVVEPVAPAPDDWVFTKWRYSAFFKSALLERMREHRRDQLVVCGVYAHVGVLMTAVEAFTNDIQSFLVADAVADFSEQYHRFALDYAAQRCAVVTTTETVLAELDSTKVA